jgi:uncharacterized protein YpmS
MNIPSVIRTMGWKKAVLIMLSLLTMAPTVFAQSGGDQVIYIDPFTLVIFLAVLAIVIAVAIFAFMAIHNATVQNQLVATYQQTSQAQTTIMNNMAQAITTNLYMQTGVMVEEARHRMNMDDRWFNLMAQQQAFMQYMDNRQLNIYEKQVDANIQFMNNVFNLLAMQTAFSDISQLNKDKLRAMAIQSAKPYEIEIITTETPEKKETTTKT